VIGIGNEFRGDDGLGLFAARELSRRAIDGLRVIELNGEGASLMEAWRDSDRVVVIDAASSGGVPGTLYRFDVSTEKVPGHLFMYSSHSFGLVQAIEMAREVHRLPRIMVVYAIEGERFEHGAGLSRSVLKSIPRLVTMVERDMNP
jgi:hydrogenase maturation protease